MMEFEEIGQEMGLSAARVRQIFCRGIDKIRQAILDEPELLEALSEVMMDSEEVLKEQVRGAKLKQAVIWK